MSWDGGAITLATLVGDGRFSFVIPSGVAGAVVGLNTADASVRPEEIQHGVQVSAGEYRIVELGEARTEWAPVSGLVTYHVVRFDSVVYYCVGTTPEAHADVPGGLPGELVYTSAVASHLPCVLDASLWGIGDEVQDATLHALDGAIVVAHATFPPMGALGSDASYAYGSGVSAPMDASGEELIEYSSAAVFPSAEAFGSESASYAFGSGVSAPLIAWGSGSTLDVTIYETAAIFPRMRSYGTGYSAPAPAGEAVSMPPAAMGYQSDIRIGSATFPSMLSEGDGQLVPDFPYFQITLPAIVESADPADYIFDGATVLDAITEDTVHFVADGATAGDGVQVDDYDLIFDSVAARDAIQHASSDFIADGATTGDALVLDDTDFVSDGVSALDALALTSTLTDLVSDGATASESVEHGSFDLIADGASALDGIEHETAELIADGASALDALTFAGTSSDLIADGAVAGDDHVITGTSITLVEDGATARDAVFHKDPRAVAWVLNTESAAPYWYSNWQIDDMVQVGDQVFAVGPEGLLLIGADTDAGEGIDATVRYGFSDFGTDQKKRVDAFWFGYTSSDVLEVSVETYGQGYPAYTYEMQPVLADQPRNNRIKPGKGLNARYWRVTLNNVGGCDFSVSDTAADLAVSARRI